MYVLNIIEFFKYVLPLNLFPYLSRNFVRCFIAVWCSFLITNPNKRLPILLSAYENMKFSRNEAFVDGNKYLAYSCRFAFRYRHDMRHTSYGLCLIEQGVSQTGGVNGGGGVEQLRICRQTYFYRSRMCVASLQNQQILCV